MIQEKQNISKAKNIKRLVEADGSARQITVLDSRYYQRKPGIFYPSVTHVLSYFPKDKFFERWMKEVGTNADYIIRRAGREGTQVHNAIEDYINGKEVKWLNDYGDAKYSQEVWRMILKFVDFWETYQPTFIKTETHLFSDELKVAGTADLICEIDGEIWLIDFKTSNALYKTYDLQLACYAQSWNEIYDTPIERAGILWLKSSKRGPKDGKMQGKGWEIKEMDGTLEDNKTLFSHLYEIFKYMHPELKPVTETLPLSVTPSK